MDRSRQTNQHSYVVKRKRRPTIYFEYPDRLKLEPVFVFPARNEEAVTIWAHTLDGSKVNILVEQKW